MLSSSPALRLVFLVFLSSVAACGGDLQESFVSDVRFDTVAVVGGADEQRPLLLYGNPVPMLLDDSTVVYSDAKVPGRMVTVNLLTGDGWEVSSGVGAEGPGEFGGTQPDISTSRGVIHTVTNGLVYNAWTREGTLIANDRYESPSWMTGFYRLVAGVLGPRTVVLHGELPEDGLIRQSIRIYDPDLGLIAQLTDGVPDYRFEVVPGEGGSVRFRAIDQVPVLVHARGETIAWGLGGQTRLVALNADGSQRSSVDLEAPIADLFLDNDERIWVRTSERALDGTFASIVLDRDLNVLFRAGTWNFVDASGDYVLALKPEEMSGALAMVLLKMEKVN